MATDLQKSWEDKIRRAKKVRTEWQEQFQTQKGRDYFEGRQNPGYPAEEWITINKIYSHLQAQLPMLYSMDPYFYVKLKKSYQLGATPEEGAGLIVQMEQKAKIRQGMLNYLKGELELKQKARMSIQDAHFEYGVVKIRHASEMEDHPHAGEPILDEDGKQMQGPDGKTMVYPDTTPINKRYEINRIHPKDFLWDEDAGPLPESWGWLAQHISMSKEDALEDSRFKRSVIKNMKGTERSDDDKKGKTGIVSQLVSKLIEKPEDVFLHFWEIYDLKECEWLMIGEGADSPVIDPRSCPPGIEDHPFAILRFTLRDASPYPIPPVAPALDLQKELCMSRSQRMTHRKRFNRKYEVDVNKLQDPDDSMSKLESGDDGTMIRVMALGAVNPIADAPLDQQGLIELQALNSDLIEIMGTGDNARGLAKTDSATEASLIDKRLEVREGDRLSIVVDFVTTIAEKLDQLVQFHLEKDEAIKITGPQGEQWMQVRTQDYQEIQGEFEYSVNVGASSPQLPQIERSQWIAFLSQVVIPFPHILTSPAIMRRMAEMFGIEDDAAIEDFRKLGAQIMAGTMPMPGGQGGGPANNPIASIMGAALGPQGGITNGGGAPTVQ